MYIGLLLVCQMNNPRVYMYIGLLLVCQVNNSKGIHVHRPTTCMSGE